MTVVHPTTPYSGWDGRGHRSDPSAQDIRHASTPGFPPANNLFQYPFFGLSPIFRVEPLAPHPVLSETRLDVEVGDRTEYTVRLSGTPSKTTRIVIRRIEHDENPLPTHNPVSYEPQYLTFTTTDWNTPQTVRFKVSNPLVRRPDGTLAIQDEAQVRLNHVVIGTDVAEYLDIHITKRYKCPQNLPGGAFWKACLTLGAGPGGLLGYSGATGSLGPNRSFTYDGTTYTVDGLYVQDGNLHVSFDKTPSVADFEWDLVHVVTEESATHLNRVTHFNPIYGPPWGEYDAATHTYIMEGERRPGWVDGAKISVALDRADDGDDTGGQRVAPRPPATFGTTPGDGEVTLDWTAPEENADAITAWQVRHGEVNVNNGSTDWEEWTGIAGSTGTTTTHTVTDAHQRDSLRLPGPRDGGRTGGRRVLRTD